MIQAVSGNQRRSRVSSSASGRKCRTDAAAGAISAEVRHRRAIRDLRRPNRREQGLQGAVRVFRRISARRLRHSCRSCWSASRCCRFPQHPRIRHLGFLDDADKFDAMAAADMLIVPSYFESLSMVALEAWALGRPVVANGQLRRPEGPVHPQQRRAVLRELSGVSGDRSGRSRRTGGSGWRSATNGRRFFREHYEWPVIERKYLDVFERAQERTGRGRRMEPLPRWLERRRRNLPPAQDVVARLPEAARPCIAARGSGRGRDARRECGFIRSSRRWGTATRSATRCSASSGCSARPATNRRSSSRPPTRGSNR